MKLFKLAFALVVALVSSGHAQPQTPPGGPGAGGFRGPRFSGPPPNAIFNAIDVDGDGVITGRELRKAVAALKKLDADGDGNISLAEVSPQRGPEGDPSQFVDRIMENDKNGDGKLSPAELPEPMRRLVDDADTNSDGTLDRQELVASMESRRGRFGGLRNADPQQISAQLMAGDRNGDGKLTPNEVPPQAAGMLRNADSNGDGAIDSAELQAAAQQFGGSRPNGNTQPPRN